MIAANCTELRGSMRSYFDQVCDGCETLVITRPKGSGNVVVISEDQYNNMMENMHLMGTEANRSWLLESKAQLESGSGEARELL